MKKSAVFVLPVVFASYCLSAVAAPQEAPKETPSAAKVISPTAAETSIIYDGEESAAAEDLREVLKGYKAGEILLEKVELGQRIGQDFFLERKKEKTLIRYTTQMSLENAVYTLLDRWGFHWYGPGENWLVKPKAVSDADIQGKWLTPTFRNRGFFGTGGLDFGDRYAFDPDNEYKKGWYAWKRRNRFNSDVEGVGHMGEAFYLENKELLDAHPDWFNGDRGKKYGRIRIEVPEAVAAYKAWVRKKFDTAKGPFITLGVDPEDGRGGSDDPLPPDGFAGIDGWNHADKWWWLANEVAKEYPEDNSHIMVSMYAYGDGPTNALAPKFTLRKNVYPIIIPYAFQKAYMPAEMVKVWAGQIEGNMGLYDYWNITQWSLGMPQFALHDLKGKLEFWEKNKVDGLYIETTDAAGPMGHAWWLAGQLEFDLSKNFEALYNQYLTDLFGKAAPAMKKMYDRWSKAPQAAGEVSLSLANLKEADSLVSRNSPEWKRINELKAYVHFMKMYYEHDNTQESKDRIYEYLYSIHHLYMVQTAAFIGQAYILPWDKGNITPKGTDKWLTPEEIDAQFQADLKSNPKVYDVADFTLDYTKARATEPIGERVWLFGRSPSAGFAVKEKGTVSFDIGNKGGDTQVTVYTNEGTLVNDTVGVSDSDYTEAINDGEWKMKHYFVDAEPGKLYIVNLRGGYNRLKMKSDVVIFNFHNNDDFDNYAYPWQYFYVPKSCNELIFQDDIAAERNKVFTGALFAEAEDGTWKKEDAEAEFTGIRNLYRIKVKPEWQGKVIACGFGHTAWALKNLPNAFALQPFEYTE